ncbi:MAG: tetratricopeptide repeat protein [Idiomarina sp.]|nr:tetratricopeptide repeat protein [Idiomarina sp.]
MKRAEIEVIYNKAKRLLESGRYDKAEETLLPALSSQFVRADTFVLLAIIREKLNQIELTEEALLEALSLDANHIRANSMLLKHLFLSSQFERAVETADHVLSLDPLNIEALLNKANALWKLHQIDDAIDLLTEAHALYPKEPSICNNLGNLYASLSDIETSLAWYKKAHDINPNDLLAYSNITTSVHYHPSFSFSEIHSTCIKWGSYFKSQPYKGTHKGTLPNNKSQTTRQLNVGFISDGFRRHPVGYMVTATLENISEESFKLFAYTTNDQEDDITRRIRQAVDSWTPIARLSAKELAKQVKEDKIDVLIDLAGHMSGTRMQTIAMKPAPIIIKWVGGLINTTGVDAIDYLISDHIETPNNIDPYYVEKLIRLPHDYICYEPPLYAPNVGPLPHDSNGYITFGCFNNGTKISTELLTEWADILNQVPNSKLILKSTQYNVGSIKQKIWDHVESLGIEPTRILIEGPSKHAILLDTYNRIDIALDSWPYSGGLTTCEALYMGVPVVTYPGPTFAGRHSATHLVNAGLSELVTDSWDEFKGRVIELTKDIDSLRVIRQNLRTVVLNSPLCDIESFAQSFSTALSVIWQRYCEGKPPTALSFTDTNTAQFDDESRPVQIKQLQPSSRTVKHKESKKGEFEWQFTGQVIVIDNACDLLTVPNLSDLRTHGAFAIVALDPTSKIKNVSEFLSDKNIEIHQHVQLGNGEPATLNACLDSSYTSTLEPLVESHQLSEVENPTQVLAKIPIPTIALDQIKGLSSLDTLILDQNSDIKTILANGTKALQNTYILKLKLALHNTHKEQTSLSDMNAWAEKNRFRFYSMTNYQYSPGSDDAPDITSNELLTADIIYVPTNERIANMTAEEIEKFAFICDRLLNLKDLALKLLSKAAPTKIADYIAHTKSSSSSSKVLLSAVIANNKPLLPKPHGLSQRLVVSLTSYPKRFNTLSNSLRCLLNQTITPDHIVLWIAHEDKEQLPNDVTALKQHGVQIKFCDDIGSYKKIIPTIEHFNSCFIATADDDIYYWPTWLEELVALHRDDEKSIAAHRIHKIELNSKQEPMGYKDWHWNYSAVNKANPLYFATSGAGVLFPPQVLKKITEYKSEISSLCANTDDIWLYWMIRAAGYQYKHTGSQKLMTWDGSHSPEHERIEIVQQELDRMLTFFDASIFKLEAKKASPSNGGLSIPNAPFMSAAEQGLFKKCLQSATQYFEFGSGGSSVWAVKQGLDVHGVESDKNWIDALVNQLGNKCKIDFSDIGPTGDWGYPTSNKFKQHYPKYSAAILNHEREFDLILIDGRFRVACLFSTLIYLLTKHSKPESVTIFIHDFWNRQDSYSAVLDYLDEAHSAESAGTFKIKKGLKLSSVRSMYEKYKYIPE